MPAIELIGVTKCYGDLLVLDDVSFSLEAGGLMWVSGPSGCGKTTLLRVIAGLEPPDSGTVMIKNVTAGGPGIHLAPADRDMGMVFQDFALWPHMSVKGHLNFVLKGNKVPARIRQTRIEDLIDLAQLHDRRGCRPAELSGGQQQRLAIVRALAADPAILLMDEPFSNLDAELTKRLLSEILRRKRDHGLTIVIATHESCDIEPVADKTFVISG